MRRRVTIGPTYGGAAERGRRLLSRHRPAVNGCACRSTSDPISRIGIRISIREYPQRPVGKLLHSNSTRRAGCARRASAPGKCPGSRHWQANARSMPIERWQWKQQSTLSMSTEASKIPTPASARRDVRTRATLRALARSDPGCLAIASVRRRVTDGRFPNRCPGPGGRRPGRTATSSRRPRG